MCGTQTIGGLARETDIPSAAEESRRKPTAAAKVKPKTNLLSAVVTAQTFAAFLFFRERRFWLNLMI
jgi:hypothetical protein